MKGQLMEMKNVEELFSFVLFVDVIVAKL